MKTPEELEAQVQKTQKSNKKLQQSIALQNKLSNPGSISPSPDNGAGGGLLALKDLLASKVNLLNTSLEDRLTVLSELLNFDLTNFEDIPEVCPPASNLTQALSIRNAIVSSLEELQTYLELTENGIDITSKAIDGTLTTVDAISLLKTATAVGVKVSPAVPGVVSALISDLDDIRTFITFEKDGTSRLPKLKYRVEVAQQFTSVVYTLVGVVIQFLNQIDSILLKCGSTPAPITLKIQSIAKQGTESLNEALYKGFKLRIVDRKYNENLTQKIGQALNINGIVLLETEPSFTLKPSSLLEELKILIDSQNLKPF